MKKKYWLILDSYVFIWSNKDSVLIYNSLSGKSFALTITDQLSLVIDRLQVKENLYCIEISSNELVNIEIKGFIKLLRTHFCGDLLDQSISNKKPLVYIPELNINEEIDRTENLVKSDAVFGQEVVRNLSEITFYVTGECRVGCHNCDKTNKQLEWCCNENNELEINSIKNFIRKNKKNAIQRLNFFGGDLFNYSYLDELLQYLNAFNVNQQFYSHYTLLPTKASIWKYIQKDNCNLNLLIDGSFNEGLLIDAIETTLKHEIRANFNFIVEDEDQYEYISDIIEKYELSSKIQPHYNGSNLKFFKDHIYLTEEDLKKPDLSKREVFAHQALNTNDFGKLTITPDGKVYANPKFPALGTIEDEIRELVYKEMDQGSSWRRTRDMEPCSDCVYQWLCPSPSNYELAIGKPNLCHVKP